MNEYLQALQAFKADYAHTGEYDVEAIELKYLYSWAIPNDDAIAYLVSHSPILEVGAGTGYWAYLIQKAGGEVIAYDSQPYQNLWCKAKWSDVLVGNESVSSQYPNHTLFICWPPPYAPMAYNAVVNYAGKRIIYIGEGRDGTTADSDFFDLISKDWKVDVRVSIPRLVGMHDQLISFIKK